MWCRVPPWRKGGAATQCYWSCCGRDSSSATLKRWELFSLLPEESSRHRTHERITQRHSGGETVRRSLCLSPLAPPLVAAAIALSACLAIYTAPRQRTHASFPHREFGQVLCVVHGGPKRPHANLHPKKRPHRSEQAPIPANTATDPPEAANIDDEAGSRDSEARTQGSLHGSQSSSVWREEMRKVLHMLPRQVIADSALIATLVALPSAVGEAESEDKPAEVTANAAAYAGRSEEEANTRRPDASAAADVQKATGEATSED